MFSRTCVNVMSLLVVYNSAHATHLGLLDSRFMPCICKNIVIRTIIM